MNPICISILSLSHVEDKKVNSSQHSYYEETPINDDQSMSKVLNIMEIAPPIIRILVISHSWSDRFNFSNIITLYPINLDILLAFKFCMKHHLWPHWLPICAVWLWAILPPCPCIYGFGCPNVLGWELYIFPPWFWFGFTYGLLEPYILGCPYIFGCCPYILGCWPYMLGCCPYMFGCCPYIFGCCPYIFGCCPYILGCCPYMFGCCCPYIFGCCCPWLYICCCWGCCGELPERRLLKAVKSSALSIPPSKFWSIALIDCKASC